MPVALAVILKLQQSTMTSDPIINYEKEHHTLLKSWLSSVLLHAVLVALLIYFLKSPESGLGNNQGSLTNFRKVGIHLKEPQTEQFEQTPTDESSENQTSSDTALETTTPPEKSKTDDPFSKPPIELTLPPALTGSTNLKIPVEGSGTSSDTTSASGLQSSGTLPDASAAPLGIGESAFLGIRSQGKKVVFLLDHSESMNGSWDDTKVKPLDFAKANLKFSLNQLSLQHQFQIIFYNRTFRHLTGNENATVKLLPATELNRNKAYRFVNQIRAGNSTAHLPALKAAMSIKPDVVYFLTDTESELTKGEMNIIHRSSRNTIINCIEFGKGPPLEGTGLTQRNFLQRFASMTGGEYRYIDITKLTKEGQ